MRELQNANDLCVVRRLNCEDVIEDVHNAVSDICPAKSVHATTLACCVRKKIGEDGRRAKLIDSY